MAKIILKCPYYKPGKRVDNYVRYIATRSGVEKPDSEKLSLPATQVQAKAVGRLIKKYPDLKELFEYEDYLRDASRGNAVEFISRAGEAHPELIDGMGGYIAYIATRPGTMAQASHGLFSDAGAPVVLEQAAAETAAHRGNVWCHIISLKREDAARLGYDNVGAWQDMLRGQRNMVAKAMKIHPENFRWYAAFHNESHHPHVHMVCYSSEPNEPWLSKDGILSIKSSLARQIFRHDLLHVYERQTGYRDALRGDAKTLMQGIIADIKKNAYCNQAVQKLLMELSDRLSRSSGKKVYGYLKPDVKAIVDRIVDEIAKDARISKLYDLWHEERENVIRTYSDRMPERIPLSQNKEFKPVKNIVISEAMSILAPMLTDDGTDVDLNEKNDESFDWERIGALIAGNEDGASGSLARGSENEKYDLYRKAKQLLNKRSDGYDPKEAIRLLYRSAKMGYEWAQYRLGRIFLVGRITKPLIGYGLAWLFESEKQGNHCAQTLLGRSCLRGIYTEQDFEKAEHFLGKAARQEDAIAEYALAKMHIDGIAKNSSISEAVRLLRLSAEHDYEWGQYLYGKYLMQGVATDKDVVGAEKYLVKAAKPQARPWQSEDETPKGNKYAQYQLAKLYLADDGIPMEPEKAAKWLGMSAEQGYGWAQYMLGKMLLYGNHVQRDPDAGLAWLSAAEAQGNSYAGALMESYHRHSSGLYGNAAVAAIRLIGKLSTAIGKKIDDKGKGSGAGFTEGKLWREIRAKKQAQGIRM